MFQYDTVAVNQSTVTCKQWDFQGDVIAQWQSNGLVLHVGTRFKTQVDALVPFGLIDIDPHYQITQRGLHYLAVYWLFTLYKHTLYAFSAVRYSIKHEQTNKYMQVFFFFSGGGGKADGNNNKNFICMAKHYLDHSKNYFKALMFIMSKRFS